MILEEADEATSVECPKARRKVSGEYALNQEDLRRRERVREIERVLVEYLSSP